MKISKIKYITLDKLNKLPSFNIKKDPRKQRIHLKPIIWLLSFPEIKKCHLKINKVGMENVKPPYLILCNHNSFIDFKVLTKAIYPYSSNYVVAIDGFINREGLLRDVGCICKRKFLKETNIVRKISYSLNKNKCICALYPEARYSHVGTNAVLPDSLSKMIKLLKCQVVTLICHGNHLRQPVWNLGLKREVDIEADMTNLVTKEEVENLSIEEINQRIHKAFDYNDYEYQINNHILIKENNRALGLERVLYKCPNCLSEDDMCTEGSTIYCGKCHTKYDLTEEGKLVCLTKENITTIPEWYEWERKCVNEEILSGKYNLEVKVNIDDLKNSKGFYRIGEGVLTHNQNGLTVRAKINNKDFCINKTPLDNYSVHVEYAYFGRGDAVSFSFLDDSYYMFPVDNKNVVTKIHFAVEEIYKINKK